MPMLRISLTGSDDDARIRQREKPLHEIFAAMSQNRPQIQAHPRPDLVADLNWYTAAVFRVLGALDVSRVDFRLDAPEGPPKAARIAKEQVIAELRAAGAVALASEAHSERARAARAAGRIFWGLGLGFGAKC